MTNLYPRLFARHCRLPGVGEPWEPRTLPGCGAVLALVARDGTLIQLLGTQSLRHAVGTRLVAPPAERSKRRANLRGVADTLWWQRTDSVFETTWVYLNVARQLRREDYRAQLGFGPSWCACLDPRAPYPCWIPQCEPFGDRVVAAGPFVSRKSCASFIDDLVDLFDLCRDHDILERAPHGQRCVYYDLGKCPAPCDGTVGLDVFRRSVSASIRFAAGDARAYIQDCSTAMRQASERLDFESAHRLKEKIEHARELTRRSHRLALTPRTCRYLIVQAGSRRQWVRPFFADAGRIERGVEVRRDALAGAIPHWRAWFARSDNAPAIDPRFRTEGLWLVSHFLAQGKKASGVYLRMHEPPDVQTVLQCINARFFGRTSAARRDSPTLPGH